MKPETRLQITIMEYLDLVLPESARAFHFHQSGKDKKEQALLARMGVKPGLQDIGIIRSCGRIYLIELKTPKTGRLSPDQIEMRKWCTRWGIPHCVARSIEDVRAFLADEGFETREVFSQPQREKVA